MISLRASLIVLAMATPAVAQPRQPPPAVVGATEVIQLTTPSGFIDDAIAVDGDRVGYVVADAASRAELHVVTLATKQDQVVNVAAVTLHPIGLRLVGHRALVIGRQDDGRQVAAMVELGGRKPGKIVYKIAAANHLTLITRDGRPRIAVHRETAGASIDVIRHQVELLALETGRRVAAPHTLELAGNVERKLEFRVNHWGDGWTRAFGIKAGEWSRKEDQKMPDVEATYDLVRGKLVARTPITDLFEQHRRFAVLAAAGGRLDFVHHDPKGLQLWRGGHPRPLALDQPVTQYDLASIQDVIAPDALWLAIKVDPVNPDAVARKKADPEYLDIYRATADGKATRTARVLAKGVRYRFGVAGRDRFWLLERNQTIDRGGKRLVVYHTP